MNEKLKKLRRERSKKVIKRLIVDMGEMPLLLYIAFTSIWISLSSTLWIYSKVYPIINEWILLGRGNEIIYAFVTAGLIIFIWTICFGIASMLCYRANVRLIERGEKKTKGYLKEILEEKKEK